MTVIEGRVDRESPMGATPVPGGTGFRTWAPNALTVALVTGDALHDAGAPDWRPAPTDALESLGDGSWGGFAPGIKDGDPYLFYVKGHGSAGLKRDPFARELSTEPPYPDCFCLVRTPASYPWHDDQWHPPDISDLMIYQLHVGTWWAQDRDGNDSRSSRDGTFLDVVARLDYLVSLGVNAVQLLPVQEFETGTSMGYNGIDPFSPETLYCVGVDEIDWRLAAVNRMLARFGKTPLTRDQLMPGINQLKCLVDLSHLNGIAVIFDQVYNHAFGHDDRGKFDERSLWFYDRQIDGNRNNSLYFTDQVWIGPVFAYWQNWVSQFLIDNACSFLDEYHADGFRYDEVSAISNFGGDTFARNLTQTVRAHKPAAVQIAEYWNGDRWRAVHPVPEGLGFDAELADGLREALRTLVKQASFGSAAPLSFAALNDALSHPPAVNRQLNQCLENQDKTFAGHADAARISMLADGNDRRSWYARSRSRAATSILMTAPGIPSIFMGQEFLEDKNWNDNRAGGGLIWWQGLSGADPAMRDFQKFFSDLAHVRKDNPALRAGLIRVSHADDFERVFVMHRWLDSQGMDVVITVNFDELPKRGYPIGLPAAGKWLEIFNSDVYDGFPNPSPVGNGGAVIADMTAGDGFGFSARLDLPANGALILRRG